MAASASAGKWHASFKTENSMEMLQIADNITKAGGTSTAVMDAQDSTWFETWSTKCAEAEGVVVIFSEAYRSKFSTALQKEASCIRKLHLEEKIKLFIFDPERHKPAEVRACIMDGNAGMGDIKGWYSFVQAASSQGTAQQSGTGSLMKAINGHWQMTATNGDTFDYEWSQEAIPRRFSGRQTLYNGSLASFFVEGSIDPSASRIEWICHKDGSRGSAPAVNCIGQLNSSGTVITKGEFFNCSSGDLMGTFTGKRLY